MPSKRTTTTAVLVDAQALIHRAFHALPLLTDRRGKPTNAVYGFFSVFLKMIKDVEPEYVAACFDRAEPTFRHKVFAGYKAQRPKTPEALIEQVPVVKELLKALKVPVVELAGYEADDLIGTLATRLSKAHPDWRVIITTGDLDTLQLVSDRIAVYTLKKGVSDTTVYDVAAIKKRYGLTPEQIVDYKGLVGDQSDNIPGVKGIGETSAIALLKKFGTVENIYKVLAKDGKRVEPSRVRARLQGAKDEAFFSKALATIHCDAPIDFTEKEARWGQFDKAEAVASFLRYGFRSLVERLPFDTKAYSTPKSVPRLSVKRHAAWPKGMSGKGQVVSFEGATLVRKEGNMFALGPFTPEAIGEAPVVYDYKPLYKALIKAGVAEPGAAGFDSMLAAWLERPGRSSYSAEAFFAQYFGVEPVVKGEDCSESEQAAVRRAALAHKVRERLAPVLKREGLTKVLADIELPLTPILARMELAGIKIDLRVLAGIKSELSGEIIELEKAIYKKAGEEFNIQSPKQLSEILFGKLELPSGNIRKTPTGALSTDEQELAKLLKSHSIVGDILAFRERTKLLNTYVEPLPRFADEQSRLHTTFIQTGTVTGRLSSAEPNLQNIPLRSDWGKRIRGAFVAEPGWSFISCDFSQIDLRVVAHIAKDKHMLEAFRNNEDIHTTTAAAVLKKDPKDITPAMRRRAKAVNFGIIYGLSPFGLSESTDMAREEAKEFIDTYLTFFSGVRDYMNATKQLAKKQGYVETLLGRRRYLPALRAGNFRARGAAEREAINHPVQGTSADIMKLAMIKVDALLNKQSGGENRAKGGGLFAGSPQNKHRRARMLLQLHDELIFEVPDEQVASLAPKIQKAMESAYKLDIPLKVEVSVGKNWGQLKA